MGGSLVLIVEDNEDMARLNARLLKRHGYEAIVAETAAKARELFYANTPDLLVLDIGLPDGDGLALCQEFRQRSDVPVLFLTGKTTTSDKVAGLETGGDYYLTKPFDKQEFLCVVQSLLRRVERMQDKIAEASTIVRGPLTLNLLGSRAFVRGEDANLTQKEFAILLLLVQNENTELSYEAIYKKVWGLDMNNDSSTVRQHISRLKKKIGEESTDDFSIFNEHGRGYTFVRLSGG